MRETDLIRTMCRHFRRSPEQENRLFGSDAEIVTIGGQLWAITIDEFSNEEDGFGTLDTPSLGHNLVAAVLSDLVAVGATPRFFMHALAVPPGMEDTEAIETLARSIAETLDEAGAFLLGGDVGQAPSWRYSGVALGPIESGRPITRQVGTIEQDLWITGKFGAMNWAMLTGEAAPSLNLHSTEVRNFIARHATGCIDTSGGLIDALWTMHEQSPGVRFELDTSLIPYDPSVLEFATSHDLPPIAFLLGGAGEYELLFTTPVGLACDMYATRIGRVSPCKDAGLWMTQDGHATPITEPPPCPREYRKREDYVCAIRGWMCRNDPK